MKKLTTKEFIKKANKIHNNKYDYSNSKYVNAKTKIIIICSKHGNFIKTPDHHLRGQSCPKCTSRKTTKEFIKKANKIHNNKYDYSKVNYKTSRKHVIIICPKHGKFLQLANSHLNGKGCKQCTSKSISKKSQIWLNKIEKENNIKLTRELLVKINNRKFVVDGFYKSTNTIYEYYGDYWHGNPKCYKSYMINKVIKKTFGELYNKTMEREKCLTENGYKLITKWENHK